MKKISFIYVIAGMVIALLACDKIDDGYLSRNIYYAENPFTVGQGVTTYSEALETDQSSIPVYVELLDIRNVRTGETAEQWYGDSEITFWLEEVTASDTTLDQVLAKYSYREYPIFKVNSQGGRLEFSEGTRDLEPGEYEIDVKVSNTRGTMILKNACTIILKEAEEFLDMAGTQFYDKWTVQSEGAQMMDAVYTYREIKGDELEQFKSRLAEYGQEYDPNYGYQILKVQDNYGNNFNWSPNTESLTGGEIRKRVDTGLGNYEVQSPWQEMIYTSDALISPFYFTPFPLFNRPDPGNGIKYYRIIPSATNMGVDINIGFSWKITRKGVFEVIYKLAGDSGIGTVRRVTQ